MTSLNKNLSSVNIRDERTAGSAGGAPGLAVIEVRDTGAVQQSVDVPSRVNTKDCLVSSSTNSGGVGGGTTSEGYIVGWNSLVSLLQPVHRYFHDKLGIITRFVAYKHKDTEDGKKFLFPRITGETTAGLKSNPYRRYQLSRSNSGKVVGQLSKVAEVNKLTDFRMAVLIPTMPADVSLELSNRGKSGLSISWSMFRAFWKGLPDILNIAGELAGMSNLHAWASEMPLKPHFHFHCCVLNYYLDAGGSFRKWFGTGLLKSSVDRNGYQHSGYFPFSDGQLLAVKQLWSDIVRRSCRRNGIKCQYLNQGKLLNVYIDFARWDDGKAKFIHKVNYQRRHWSEDYAYYSNEHPDCDDPPVWLEHYNNRSRVFGWWKALSQFAGSEDDSPGKGKVFEKVDILTGEALVRDGVVEYDDLDVLKLFSYDNYKGKPLIEPLDDYSFKWLKSVCERSLYDQAMEDVDYAESYVT